MGIISCPVCSEILEISGKSYVCKNRHCFDISKSGYVNLLVGKHGTVHGDNKLMVKSRREFLEKGYYKPLRDSFCDTVGKFLKSESTVLDAGCGEGYYTFGMRELSESADIYGIDISKTAVEYASKRNRNIIFMTASVFDIPLCESSCDILTTLFSPYCREEFQRVLKKDGIMIMVIPSENHLWELKQAIYDKPYKNTVKPYELDGFEFLSAERISFTIDIENDEDIRNLFSMTPYFYKTGIKEQQRIDVLSRLETQADFEILTYRKK